MTVMGNLPQRPPGRGPHNRGGCLGCVGHARVTRLQCREATGAVPVTADGQHTVMLGITSPCPRGKPSAIHAIKRTLAGARSIRSSRPPNPTGNAARLAEARCAALPSRQHGAVHGLSSSENRGPRLANLSWGVVGGDIETPERSSDYTPERR